MDSKIRFFEQSIQQKLRDVGIDATSYNRMLHRIASYEKHPAVADAKVFFEENIAAPLFEKVTNWDDLLALYIVFARGGLSMVPTHGGPLLLDSQTQKNQLERVMRLGALTVDSQPGICEPTKRQRAYVEFWVNPKDIDVESLYKNLVNQGLITTMISNNILKTNVDTFISRWKPLPSKWELPVPALGEQMHLPDPFLDESYLVDEEQGGKRSICLTPVTHDESNRWFCPTRDRFDATATDPVERTDDTVNAMEHYCPKLNFSGSKFTFFSIVHPKYCQINLVSLLEKALTQLRTRLNESTPPPKFGVRFDGTKTERGEKPSVFSTLGELFSFKPTLSASDVSEQCTKNNKKGCVRDENLCNWTPKGCIRKWGTSDEKMYRDEKGKPMSASDIVRQCVVHPNTDACGKDPSCIWTSRGCIRKRGGSFEKRYSGPYIQNSI